MMANSTTIKLPYCATVTPGPLPTEAEIDAAKDISLRYGGRRVVEIGTHFVVKFGSGVKLIEGENMLFIRERTKVPVPQVYALYAKDGQNYIVMERIDGHTLLSQWEHLDVMEKKSIVGQLRSYFEELRTLQHPGYYGSIGERCLQDGVFATQEPAPEINGPFHSEDAFLEALALKYTYDGRPVLRAEFYRQNLPRILKGHGPVFSHGDCQQKNIMIRRHVRENKQVDAQEWEVIILDWETSGWYPSYWEYCMAYCGLRYDDDWCLWLQEVLDPYVAQSAWFHGIRLELWS